MKRIVTYLFAGLAAGVGIVMPSGEAGASCGSANCFLVTGTQEGIAAPGQVILDLSYRWMRADTGMAELFSFMRAPRSVPSPAPRRRGSRAPRPMRETR